MAEFEGREVVGTKKEFTIYLAINAAIGIGLYSLLGDTSQTLAGTIFLALVSGALASGGFINAAIQFLLYAAGMAFVITVLTVGIALARSAVSTGTRRLLPYVGAVSGTLLILAGAYIVFYWLTEGGLAGRM